MAHPTQLRWTRATAIGVLTAMCAALLGVATSPTSAASPLDDNTLVVTQLAQQSHGDGKGQGSAVAVAAVGLFG